ncbi:P-loop containing nucleoside triphosphate hydrolase protein [Periconia macrospinosa]|uniref:P-loop containing nucleoside triphosphate hydrolase protein n=1 Tax=Periconia macrospinosa TaxID=97972 RepID=A0A2V1DX44_9PLEO|nr:P-loop containing nucleoside triphosphate hydrolase protein [Periconia macrospinosa]
MRAALLFTLRPRQANLSYPRLRTSTASLLLPRQFYSRSSGLQNDQVLFTKIPPHEEGSRLPLTHPSRKPANKSKVKAPDRKSNSPSKSQHPKLFKNAHQPTSRTTRRTVSQKPTKSSSQEETHSNVITRDYVVNHLGLPARGEFPNAPQEIQQMLEKDTGILNNRTLIKLLRPYLSLVSLRIRKTKNPNFPTRTMLKVTIKDGTTIEAHGDGVSDRDSWYHSFLHLIAQLYKTQYWADFYKPTVRNVTRTFASDPKVTVFDYAARFMLIPTYTSEPIRPETLKTLKRQGMFKKMPPFQCTIDLPEQKIVAIGTGSTPYLAECAASIRFVELVRDHEANGAPAIQSPQKVPFLGTSVMDSFENFCRRMRKDLTVTREQQLQDGDRTLHSAAVNFGEQPIGQKIITSDERQAKDIALLTAAVSIGNKDPEFLASFETALQEGSGKVLRSLSPINLNLSNDALDLMADAIQIGHPVQKLTQTPTLKRVSEGPSRSFRMPTDHKVRSAALQQAYQNYQTSSDTELKRQKREELPINQYRAGILDMVAGNTFTVVVGATGSGKTTQVPQMFLDAASSIGKGAACNVICTQPRRIAATSVARRVAEERGEALGDSVGYMVRGNAQPPRQDGSILFCTAGTLLQQLKADADHVFDTTSHILLDEVHERDAILDYLLIVTKETVKRRMESNKPVPKVVLMSATMNTELFSQYFGAKNAAGDIIPCPSINVPGRLFPVKNRHLREIDGLLRSTFSAVPNQLDTLLKERDTEKYLDKELQQGAIGSNLKIVPDATDEDALAPIGLVAATVAHVAKTTDQGAVLVFLPGQQEILATQLLLTRQPILDINFGDNSRYKIFILHSSVSAEDQAAVFDAVPEGCRKIILSTNIAETSVTIPDIQHVIDTGKHREIQYDPITRITALKTSWISKANAKQRAGRAGRVQNGNYYGLYTEERLEKLKVTGTAELLRSDLEKICLDVKAHNFNDSIEGFLSKAIEPPSSTNIQSALSGLRSLEALSTTDELTPLGQLLSTLPVQPALGKMIVLGIIFRCLDSAIILGSLSESRGLFLKPSGLRSQWEASHQKWLGTAQSEHIAQIRAFKYLRKYSESHTVMATRRHANDNFLSVAAFEQIKRTTEEIEEILIKSNLIPLSRKFIDPDGSRGNGSDLDENSGNIQLIKALAIVGFAPNLAYNYGGRWFRTAISDEVAVHSKSFLVGRGNNVVFGGTTLTYTTLSTGDDNYLTMRDITEVPRAAALLFGGEIAKTGFKGSTLHLRGWLPFRMEDQRDLSLVFQFRQVLDTMLSNAFHEMATLRHQDESTTSDEVPSDRKRTGRNLLTFLKPNQGKKYLSDDAQRNKFAQKVVAILDQLDADSRMSRVPSLGNKDRRSHGRH